MFKYDASHKLEMLFMIFPLGISAGASSPFFGQPVRIGTTLVLVDAAEEKVARRKQLSEVSKGKQR